MLIAGLNPVLVSNQMGQSLQMLIERYAKWMHGDKNKIKMEKLIECLVLSILHESNRLHIGVVN